MPARKIVLTLLGILAPIAIIVLMRQLPAMLERLGAEVKIVSIGLLSVTCFFSWHIVSGLINQQRSSPPNTDNDGNVVLVFIIAIDFTLGMGSLVGLFLNGFGFLIGFVSGSLGGYQVGLVAVSEIHRRRIPLFLPVLFMLISLFGVIAVLSLYLVTGLSFVFVNVVLGLILGDRKSAV